MLAASDIQKPLNYPTFSWMLRPFNILPPAFFLTENQAGIGFYNLQ